MERITDILLIVIAFSGAFLAALWLTLFPLTALIRGSAFPKADRVKGGRVPPCGINRAHVCTASPPAFLGDWPCSARFMPNGRDP